MKAREITRECVATVGVTAEFNMSEVTAISKFGVKISEAIGIATSEAMKNIKTAKDIPHPSELTATINLSTLLYIEHILSTITGCTLNEDVFGSVDIQWMDGVTQRLENIAQ